MQCIIFSWWILWVEIKPGLGGNSLQLFWGAKGRSLSRMRWWRAVHRVCIHANWSTSRHSLLPGRWRRPHLKVSRWNCLVYFLGSPILQLTNFCFRLIPKGDLPQSLLLLGWQKVPVQFWVHYKASLKLHKSILTVDAVLNTKNDLCNILILSLLGRE